MIAVKRRRPRQYGTTRASGASSPAELRAFADEHLTYEIDMLFYAALSRQVELVCDDASLQQFFRNAAVEAFVTHLRALVAFLFPDEYRPLGNDVTARSYVDATGGRPRWEDQRGPLSDTLRSAEDRADKEVSNLTDRRIAGAPPEKGWVVVPLANQLREVLLKFAAMADPERLGERVKASIPPEPLQ